MKTSYPQKKIYLYPIILVCTLLLSWSFVYAQEQEKADDSFSSVEERRLYVKIQEERENIINEKKVSEIKEKELKTLEEAVDKKLAEIDQKLAELEAKRAELVKLLDQKELEELTKIQGLSKIYQRMDPTKAALALSGLDQQLAAKILANMKAKAAAKVLDSFNKQKATEISRTFSTIQLE